MRRTVNVQKKEMVGYIFIVLFIISACFGSIQSCRLERNRRELEHVRNELECARDREQYIKNTVDGYIGRTSEILSQSVTTVTELRAQIREVRINYEEMENFIHCLPSCSSGNNDLVSDREE